MLKRTRNEKGIFWIWNPAVKYLVWTQGDMQRGKRGESEFVVCVKLKIEDKGKREKGAGWGAAGPSVVGRRRVAVGGRVGLGHRGRGTLTLAGSPLPFPYTAALASPGPAPASVWRADDTRPSTRLPWHTMGFSHHQHRLKLPRHDYSHTGMLCCVYTDTHVHACVCAHICTHSGSCT